MSGETFEGSVELDTSSAVDALSEYERALRAAEKAGGELDKGLGDVEGALQKTGRGSARASTQLGSLGKAATTGRGALSSLSGMLGRGASLFSGLGSAIGGTAASLVGMAATGGLAGVAIAGVTSAVTDVIDAYNIWDGTTQRLNQRLSESQMYLSEQERAAVSAANRINAAMTQLRTATAAARQGTLLEDALGSTEEQEAYVREAEGQLRLVQANVDDFARRIHRSTSFMQTVIEEDSLHRWENLGNSLSEMQRAEAATLVQSTQYLRQEIARRRALLEQARSETAAINEDLGIDAMSTTATTRRRGGGGNRQRELAAALEAAKRKQLDIDQQIFEAVEQQTIQEGEGLKLIEQRRLIEQERLISIEAEVQLKEKLRQDAADQLMLEEEARIAEKDHQNEMFDLEQRRIGIERQRNRVTSQAQQGMEGAYEIALRTMELRREENLSLRESFRMASKEFLKQFAMEQGKKALGAFAEAIGMIVTNPPGAASKAASGAMHAALAGAAGGVGAAIPGGSAARGGGATRPPTGGGGGGGGQGGGTTVVNYNAPMGSREIGLWSQRNERAANRRFRE